MGNTDRLHESCLPLNCLCTISYFVCHYSDFNSSDMQEFVLPYEAVRQADDPDAIVLAFLQSTYEAAANLGQWDRATLEYSPVVKDSGSVA